MLKQMQLSKTEQEREVRAGCGYRRGGGTLCSLSPRGCRDRASPLVWSGWCPGRLHLCPRASRPSGLTA